MSPKHTPGNWKAVGEFIGTDEEDSQTVAYLSCHRNKTHRPELETQANARLIANAPALLKVLVGVLTKLENTSVDDWAEYSSCSDCRFLEIEEALKVINQIDPDILKSIAVIS